jgi:hypothetical protein
MGEREKSEAEHTNLLVTREGYKRQGMIFKLIVNKNFIYKPENVINITTFL